ncbi:DMT family transporter [Candidatus Woesebacteria bacterium]|nr:DMT family transporter [Candidatus Woesebacteria bacterium]
MSAIKSPRHLALLGLIGVAFGYAVLGMNSRLLNIGFAPATQVYVRVLLGFLLSLVFFRKQLRLKVMKQISKKDVIWLLVMGGLGYAGAVLLATQAVLNTKLLNTSVIGSTLPFVVFAYSLLVLKAKFQPKLFLNLLVAVYGVIVVSTKSYFPLVTNFGIGELFALLSVLCLGWWSVGRKMLSSKLNNAEITVITMLVAGVTSLAVALFFHEPLPLASFTLPSILIGLAIGAGLNLLLTFLENFSFNIIDVVLGNQILMTSTVFSLLGGIFIFHESISLPELIGGLIIVVTVWQANILVKI